MPGQWVKLISLQAIFPQMTDMNKQFLYLIGIAVLALVMAQAVTAQEGSPALNSTIDNSTRRGGAAQQLPAPAGLFLARRI